MHSQGTKNMIDEIQRFVRENQALDSQDPITRQDIAKVQGNNNNDSLEKMHSESKSSSVNTKLAKFLSLNSEK